ncbi:MAG: metal-dependent amidase/aminoacylase/carboxypeptidase family protein [Candidatus Azotimanducaceae bacterium]|jgi:metal-dependent amidase/aminoacylase/carboxypeptidase family protein
MNKFNPSHWLAMLLLGSPAMLSSDWEKHVEPGATKSMRTVVALRHHFHANPELGNREVKTAQTIVAYLKSLGFRDIQTGVAPRGLVDIVKGGKPGPTVALRAEIDGVPVTKKTGLSFASTVKTNWRGVETGVMHARGNDAHVAILLGVAEVLILMKNHIPGNEKFIFSQGNKARPNVKKVART